MATEILIAQGRWDWSGGNWGNSCHYEAYQVPSVTTGTARLRLDITSNAWGDAGNASQTLTVSNNLDSTKWTATVAAIAYSGQNSNIVFIELPEKYAGKKITFKLPGAAEVTVDVPAIGYQLSVTASTGATAAVERTGNGTRLTETGALSANSWVYVGDVLNVTATLTAGYTLRGGTGQKTVSVADHAVNVTAEKNSYTLMVTRGAHANVTVTRGTTQLQSGDEVAYGETLTVTMSADSGYTLTTQSIKVAGVEKTSPVTVNGDVIILAATSALNTVQYDDGTAFGAAVIMYDNGTEFVPVQAWYDTGSEFAALC